MTSDDAKTIFEELPDKIRRAVAILSVPSVLTENIAEKLLQHTHEANGNASKIVSQIKSFPVWMRRSKTTWAIDYKLRKIALKKLNGSSRTVKEEALDILKNFKPDFDEYSYIESKDFELQIARLGLSIPEEFEQAIGTLRSFFEAAELFKNPEASRVVSAYIDENPDFEKFQKHLSESTLSAFYMRGLYAYRSNDYRTALKYLIPVWKQRVNSYSSIKDAAIASFLVGIIYSKNRSRFKEAEDAYKESLILEKSINNQYGLAQVYHSLGNLYSQDKNRFKEAEEDYQKSLKLLERINDKYGLAQVYHSLGNLYSQDRKYFEDAEEVYQKSIEIGKQINHTHHLAQVYHNLGNLYSKDRNRFKDAEDSFKNSLTENKKINDRVGLAQVYMNFGKLRISQNQYKEAHNLLTKSLEYEKNNYFRDIIKRLIRDLPI
jgi:tetratricopeptide (TPR) repeat protein